MPGFVAKTQKIGEPTRFNDGNIWKTWQSQLRGPLGRESGALQTLGSPPQYELVTHATQRERLPRSSCFNGADLLIRSQLYQQTGGTDWLPTQSDNLA